ncbi:DUF2141 domain-containing protein [Flavobacterium gelatinilyticum]|uniref:DUF2141 domain-containing protein n=1 Tax=Flavobacterium gelatinilyticum TaxID=3003260 RepID=UPI002480E029|nr:DUF2141 domain-containing protein [Flavobacterium gelatinilyticum]
MIKFFVSAVLLSTTLGLAQSSNLTISISSLKDNTGIVIAELYNTKESFLKKTYKTSSSAIKSNTALVTFAGLPSGEYTVLVYQDRNSNGKLDKYFIGMPKEPVACSNNAKGFMGPPKYEDAKFIVGSEDLKINIKMSTSH